MSFDKAQQFVARMRDDQAYRKTVKGVSGTKALKELLHESGFEFTESELVEAMASCMDEMEAMASAG